MTDEAAAFVAELEGEGEGAELGGEGEESEETSKVEGQPDTGLPAFFCSKCGGKKAARASKCMQPCIDGEM